MESTKYEKALLERKCAYDAFFERAVDRGLGHFLDDDRKVFCHVVGVAPSPPGSPRARGVDLIVPGDEYTNPYADYLDWSEAKQERMHTDGDNVYTSKGRLYDQVNGPGAHLHICFCSPVPLRPPMVMRSRHSLPVRTDMHMLSVL